MMNTDVIFDDIDCSSWIEVSDLIVVWKERLFVGFEGVLDEVKASLLSVSLKRLIWVGTLNGIAFTRALSLSTR